MLSVRQLSARDLLLVDKNPLFKMLQQHLCWFRQSHHLGLSDRFTFTFYIYIYYSIVSLSQHSVLPHLLCDMQETF